MLPLYLYDLGGQTRYTLVIHTIRNLKLKNQSVKSPYRVKKSYNFTFNDRIKWWIT